MLTSAIKLQAGSGIHWPLPHALSNGREDFGDLGCHDWAQGARISQVTTCYTIMLIRDYYAIQYIHLFNVLVYIEKIRDKATLAVQLYYNILVQANAYIYELSIYVRGCTWASQHHYDTYRCTSYKTTSVYYVIHMIKINHACSFSSSRSHLIFGHYWFVHKRRSLGTKLLPSISLLHLPMTYTYIIMEMSNNDLQVLKLMRNNWQQVTLAPHWSCKSHTCSHFSC